jgi:predicted DNA-binding transcriptional regulator YafY
MKIDRLLSITIALINRPTVTAKELSEKYDVSLRTIYRDIESIAAAGIPVVSCNGKGGGYSLRNNYKIDRQLLTLNDMTSILMALKGINTSLHNDKIDETIEKIECLVPDDKVDQVKRHFENIIIDLSPWFSNAAQSRILETINHGITENRLVSFSYRNLKGETCRRIVEPMTLMLKTWCWYLYGFCQSRGDYRIFRVSRIYDCELLNEPFVRRNQRFIETDFFKADLRSPVKMTLRFSPQSLSRIEEHFSSCQRTVDNNGFHIVTVDFPEDEWVYSSILGFGDSCEVLSPPHVRSIISTRLQKASLLYNS